MGLNWPTVLVSVFLRIVFSKTFEIKTTMDPDRQKQVTGKLHLDIILTQGQATYLLPVIYPYKLT